MSWGYHGIDGVDESSGERIVGATALEPLKTDLKRVAVAFQDGAVQLYEIETGILTGQLQIESNIGKNVISYSTFACDNWY